MLAQGTYSYWGTEGRTDGMTESQKLCPSAFLRKGGGQKVDILQGHVFVRQKKNKNVSGNMPEKKWVDRMGFFFFFFFLREVLPCKIPEHRYTV